MSNELLSALAGSGAINAVILCVVLVVLKAEIVMPIYRRAEELDRQLHEIKASMQILHQANVDLTRVINPKALKEHSALFSEPISKSNDTSSKLNSESNSVDKSWEFVEVSEKDSNK